MLHYRHCSIQHFNPSTHFSLRAFSLMNLDLLSLLQPNPAKKKKNKKTTKIHNNIHEPKFANNIHQLLRNCFSCLLLLFFAVFWFRFELLTFLFFLGLWLWVDFLGLGCCGFYFGGCGLALRSEFLPLVSFKKKK